MEPKAAESEYAPVGIQSALRTVLFYPISDWAPDAMGCMTLHLANQRRNPNSYAVFREAESVIAPQHLHRGYTRQRGAFNAEYAVAQPDGNKTRAPGGGFFIGRKSSLWSNEQGNASAA